MDEDALGKGEFGEAVTEDFTHVFGIVAEVDWVSVPADGEIKSVLSSGDIW